MTTTRRRPVTAFANDELIRDTAVSLLARHGIAGISLAAVARAADLSHTALTARFGGRDELLCDVWEHVAHNHLDQIVAWANEQVGTRTPLVRDMKSIKSLLQQTDTISAFSELLIVSMTTPTLRTVVRASFEHHLRDMLDSDQTLATQITFLVGTILGIVCEQRATKINQSYVADVIRAIAEDAARPQSPVNLPNVDAPHLKRYNFDTGDERRDRILESCITNIGKHGFDDTTTKMIARDAGVSEGLVFSMYPAKVDIFFDASMIQVHLGIRRNLEFAIELIDKHGSGIANAILIREWLAPHLSAQRVALLELTRMTWHDTQLRRRIDRTKQDLMKSENVPMPAKNLGLEDKAVQFVQLAIPTGLYVLVEALPDVATLPYSMVTQEVFA